MPAEVPLKVLALSLALVLCLPLPALAEEPDHAIHEELRQILRTIEDAIRTGQYDRMLPMLSENVEATSVTQDPLGSRADVSKYFQAWFGPTGYMRSLDMKLEPDALTELSADKSWGLVRGKALERYEAKDGERFDFTTRWTAVLVREPDDRWRLRAIHFGTNHLDNPVLTKVQKQLTRYGAIAAGVALVVGIALGWLLGRRRTTATR